MQDWIALTLVALAAWYVVREGLNRLRHPQAGGCSSCNACTSDKKPLVQLDLSVRPAAGQLNSSRH